MGSEGRPACGRKLGRMCSRARRSRERSIIKLSRLAPEGEDVRHEAQGCGKKREDEAELRRCGSGVDVGLIDARGGRGQEKLSQFPKFCFSCCAKTP